MKLKFTTKLFLKCIVKGLKHFHIEIDGMRALVIFQWNIAASITKTFDGHHEMRINERKKIEYVLKHCDSISGIESNVEQFASCWLSTLFALMLHCPGYIADVAARAFCSSDTIFSIYWKSLSKYHWHHISNCTQYL